jgi:hypothetical protein
MTKLIFVAFSNLLIVLIGESEKEGAFGEGLLLLAFLLRLCLRLLLRLCLRLLFLCHGFEHLPPEAGYIYE